MALSIIVSNASDSPIYEQIVKQIKGQILSGDLKAGELLPSIRSLARELRISVITTKRAYDELERDGFIDTVGGKGTFVSEQNKELLREMRVRIVEEKLTQAIEEARNLGMSADDLAQMLLVLFKEGS